MNEYQFSITAVMCAYLRACHARYDEPKIFDDFLAYPLIPAENLALIEQGLLKYLQLKTPEHAAAFSDQTAALKTIARTMNNNSNLLSRARFTEDNLEIAVSTGTQQYIILGAGLDTYAFRYKDQLNKLLVFEIDHPATQAFKKRRIMELGWEIPSQLNFIATDFRQENLAEALTKSSYNPQVKSFFSWLGVTMYLSREEVFRTLRSITTTAPVGSIVVFDYFDLKFFNPEQSDIQIQEEISMAKQAGEPMKTGFNPSALSADLAKLGLWLCEDLNQEEIQKRYTQGRKYGHIALAVVK